MQTSRVSDARRSVEPGGTTVANIVVSIAANTAASTTAAKTAAESSAHEGGSCAWCGARLGGPRVAMSSAGPSSLCTGCRSDLQSALSTHGLRTRAAEDGAGR